MRRDERSRSTQFVGLDVRKETIAVAVAELGTGGASIAGIIPNEFGVLHALPRKLGQTKWLRLCYGAAPRGYVVQRFLQRLHIDCVVFAPSLIPRKPGDLIKIDRRDA